MSTESKYYEYNPEKRNIFIEINSSRNNYFLQFTIGIFLTLSSFASAIVEVFLRRKFGERYITFAQSLGIFSFFTIILPSILRGTTQSYRAVGASFGQSRPDIDTSDPFLVLFMFVFLGFSIYHRLEIKRYGTAYDFKRFSLSDGEIFSFWHKIIGQKIGPIKITQYTVVTLFEPAISVLIGIFFMSLKFSRAVGVLLFLCGIIYGIRNFAKAQAGRNWVLDNIDKKITNEMKYDIFIGRKPKSETKGVYLPIELPEDEETRQALYRAVDGSLNTSHDIWENDNLDEQKLNSGGMGNG